MDLMQGDTLLRLAKLLVPNTNTLLSRMVTGAVVITTLTTPKCMVQQIAERMEVLGVTLFTREFPQILHISNGVLTKTLQTLLFERVHKSTASLPKTAEKPVLISNISLSRTTAGATATTTGHK